MTVGAQTPRKTYTYSGTGTPYPVTFTFIDDADLGVVHTSSAGVKTTLTLTSQYTVTGGAGSTGTITVLDATLDTATGSKLTIYSALGIEQQTDLADGAAFLPSVLEMQFDRNVRVMQQMQEELDRSVKVGVTSETSPDALLAAIDQAVVDAEAAETGAAASASTASSAATALQTAQGLAEGARDAAIAARDAIPAAADILVAGDIGVTVEAYDPDIIKAPGGVLPSLDGSNLTGLFGWLNIAPQTVLTAPTGSKISGWADGDQDAPVLSLHTASDIGDTYYSAERVDAALAAGVIGVAAGIVVAYAWEGAVNISLPSTNGLSLNFSGVADGVYHIYATLNADGSWSGVGYSALYPAYGTARLTPGSDLYNTATVRMYDGADTEVRRVYIGRVEMVGGVPTSVVEAPIGTSVKIPLGSGANITNGTTYVESNPFSSSASIELEYYARTRASSTDIRWQRVDSVQYNSAASRYYGSAPTCVNSDVAIISTGNFALAPYSVYFEGITNAPGRIKLTRGF